MNKFYVILFCFLLAGLLYIKCDRDDIKESTQIINTVPATVEDKEKYKDFKPVNKAKLDIPKVAPIGKKIVVDVLGNTSNQILQVTSFKIDYGFRNKFGLFSSASINNIDFGLSYSPLFYYRFNLDFLAGIKSSGIGLSWQLLRNTSMGASYNLNYELLLPEPRVYLSIGF